MKKRKFPWDLFWMVVLITAAMASAALALNPLVYRAERTRHIRNDIKQFSQSVEEIQEASEQAEEPMPYEELYRSIQTYNEWLVTISQGNLTNRLSTEIVPITLADYGLPDEVFGILRIPAMDLEMPIYLGANYDNLANGAAVLTQTSIPIGGENTNAVIAGHRGWNGYSEYICVDELGNLIKPDYLTQVFPRILESHGLRRIRFHDLRHSCASLLLANGVSMKQIQEWLGHSDFATTANVYAHLDYNSKLASANAMSSGLQKALDVIA